VKNAVVVPALPSCFAAWLSQGPATVQKQWVIHFPLKGQVRPQDSVFVVAVANSRCCVCCCRHSSPPPPPPPPPPAAKLSTRRDECNPPQPTRSTGFAWASRTMIGERSCCCCCCCVVVVVVVVVVDVDVDVFFGLFVACTCLQLLAVTVLPQAYAWKRAEPRILCGWA
jgi:hypothetical protein